MQNKHLLFNVFVVLPSLSLSNVIRIATNAVCRHIQLLRTSLWQNAITLCQFSPCLYLFVFCCHNVLWIGGEQDSTSAVYVDRRLSDCLENWTVTSSFFFSSPPHNCFIETVACMLVFKFCLSAQRTHNINHSTAVLSTLSLPCAWKHCWIEMFTYSRECDL